MAKEDVKLLIGADGQKAIKEIQEVTQYMGKLGSGIDGILSTASSFINWQTAAVAAFSAAGAALATLVYQSAQFADQMANMSKRTGIGTETLSKLSYVAKQSDTSIEALQKSMKFLNTALYDVSTGNKVAIDKFKEFGIQVTNSDGSVKTAEQALLSIAKAYVGLETEAQKTALATQIFGKSGQDLMPMLAEGAGGIQKLSEEAANLGMVIDENTAAQTERLFDNIEKLKTAAAGFGNLMLADLVPAFSPFNDALDQSTIKIEDWYQTFKLALKNWQLGFTAFFAQLQTLKYEVENFEQVQMQKWGGVAFGENDPMPNVPYGTIYKPGSANDNKPKNTGGSTGGGKRSGETTPKTTEPEMTLADYIASIDAFPEWDISANMEDTEFVMPFTAAYDNSLTAQLDFIDNSKNAWNGYFDDVTLSMSDYMNILGDQYADSLGGFASMFEAFANTQAQQQGIMFETARAFRAAEIVASTWTSAQKAYEYGMTFGPWTAGIMMASAIATGVGNLTNLYAAQPGTASINGGGASAAPTPNFQQRNPTGVSGGGSSRNITIKFEGFIWDKDRLAREIVPAINRAISDGVGR